MTNLYSSTTNVFTPAITTNYKERITYDANGNIQTYLRNNEIGAAKNNYSYTYAPGTNRLNSITNNVNAQTKSYAYDNIGNTTGDGMQGITNAVWNVYGKLQSVTNKDDVNISYTYSADGQRISKKVGNTEEWYVRDASGNVMATYKKDASVNAGDLSVTEIYKYGSSLLSIKDTKINVQNPTVSGRSNFVRGNDNYILTDANGNTKLTVRDTRIQVEDPANPGQVLYYLADVSTATLHSTYGANAKTYNGGFLSANFNGQRKSTEIGKDAQTALSWEYNGDVGRRWNVDPVYPASESPYLSLGGNPVIYIDPLGDFKTKFGAKWYQFWHGIKGDIDQNKTEGNKRNGEWFIQRRPETGKKGDSKGTLDEVIVYSPIYGNNKNSSNKTYNGNLIFGKTWWEYVSGRNDFLTVDVSALNFKHLSQKDIGKDGYVNLADPKKFGIYAFTGTALALGNIKLIPQGNNKYSIKDDLYDFDIKKEQGFSFRNIATAISGMIHGGVYDNFRFQPILNITMPIYQSGYYIHFKGTVYIKP